MSKKKFNKSVNKPSVKPKTKQPKSGKQLEKERRKEQEKYERERQKQVKEQKKQEKEREEYYDWSDREPADDTDTQVSDVILRNVEDLIDKEYASSTPYISYGADLLGSELDKQIAIYGRDKVAQSLENSPAEAISTAEQIVYDSDMERKKQGLLEFILIITGEVLSYDQAKMIGDAQDYSDDYSY